MQTLKGTFTALVTPFNSTGNLNEEALHHLVHLQLTGGVQGITCLGTTGEAPTLSGSEREKIIQIIQEQIQGKAHLMVGTGSYSTSQAIANTLAAEKMGANSALIVIPYYNKPTQEGLFLHFKAIAEAVNIPIVIYNIQSRTGQNLHTETLKRLVNLPSIIGIKEASGNIFQVNDVIEMIRVERPDFAVLSGDDALTLPIMALGGGGVISVASNLIPEKIVRLVNAIHFRNFGEAKDLHFKLLPLFKALFLETNPIPIKMALKLANIDVGECRLPLCSLSQENILKLKSIINEYDLKNCN